MTKHSKFDFNHTLQKLSEDERTAQVAFEELYHHIFTRLYSAAKRVLKSQELAEDLVQEIFTSIWLKRTELVHKATNFELYLHGMIKRGAYLVIRRSVNAAIIKQKHLEQLKTHDDPLQEEYAREIDGLIDQLPSPRREIFQLAKVEGMACKMIAERFQMSIETVRQHVCRALKFIHKHKRNILSFFIPTLFS